MRIVHVMRAPVDGLFGHVANLVGAQAPVGRSARLLTEPRCGGEGAASLARLPIVSKSAGAAPDIFDPLMDRLAAPDHPAKPRALTGAMCEFVHARFTLGQLAAGVRRGCRDALRAASSITYFTSAQRRTGE